MGNTGRTTKVICAFATALVFLIPLSRANAQPQELSFKDLPNEMRDVIKKTQKRCAEWSGEAHDESDLSRVSIIDLDGTGSKDIILSHRNICRYLVRGGNCDTWGCDLSIWKQVEDRKWSKVLDEHVTGEPWVSMTPEGTLEALGISMVGGNKQCVAEETEENSKPICSALLFRRSRQWAWLPLRDAVLTKSGSYAWEGLWANNSEQLT